MDKNNNNDSPSSKLEQKRGRRRDQFLLDLKRMILIVCDDCLIRQSNRRDHSQRQSHLRKALKAKPSVQSIRECRYVWSGFWRGIFQLQFNFWQWKRFRLSTLHLVLSHWLELNHSTSQWEMEHTQWKYNNEEISRARLKREPLWMYEGAEGFPIFAPLHLFVPKRIDLETQWPMSDFYNGISLLSEHEIWSNAP